MNFIPEAKQAWRFTSVQISALLAIIALVQTKWDLISDLIPQPYNGYIVAAFAVASIVARLWTQPVATAKARDGKISTLSDEILELNEQLGTTTNPVEHDALRDKLAEKKLELQKLWEIVQITKQTEPTQPV